MGRRGYPPAFRRKVLGLVEAGRPIAEALESQTSRYSWRRQDRIGRGLEPGPTSSEKAELAAAKRRIAELETELRATRRAGDGRRAPPGRGGLPGPGRVDLGLLRLAVPLTVGPAIRPAWPADLIVQVCQRSGGTYGGLRVTPSWALPRDRGRPQRRCAAAAPRRAGGVTGRPKWRHAKPDQVAADLVDRDFARSGPNQLWVTDNTEHPTREGKLSWVVVLDSASRRVVGWSIDAAPTAALVTSAPGMAMGSVGDYYDNAMIEAFWSRMQVELLDRQRWHTRVQLANAIYEYLEVFHNRQRRHSSLGMLTPIRLENTFTVA